MRYRVFDLPTKGTKAFTPTMATNPVASSFGLVKVRALMGGVPIPVRAPTRVWAPPISHDPATQGSNCAPDFILPDCYVAFNDNMGPTADAGINMNARRHNPIPVPAVAWNPVATRSMNAPVIGGRNAMAWPRAFQRWGTRSGVTGAGN